MKPTEYKNHIFTIGHSNHSLENFINLLKRSEIDVVVDVRSAPYSNMYPYFNRESIQVAFKKESIGYLYLGDSIGGRSRDKSVFEDGQIVYSKLAEKADYQSGIRRVMEGSTRFAIALMCSEKEPLDCHRTLLVSRSLVESGAQVSHIHADGKVESHEDALQRLLRSYKLDAPDLFGEDSSRVNEALLKQERKIAFSDEQMSSRRED